MHSLPLCQVLQYSSVNFTLIIFCKAKATPKSTFFSTQKTVDWFILPVSLECSCRSFLRCMQAKTLRWIIFSRLKILSFSICSLSFDWTAPFQNLYHQTSYVVDYVIAGSLLSSSHFWVDELSYGIFKNDVWMSVIRKMFRL